MPLTLLAGPANAGKVALLLDRYLAPARAALGADAAAAWAAGRELPFDEAAGLALESADR